MIGAAARLRLAASRSNPAVPTAEDQASHGVPVWGFFFVLPRVVSNAVSFDFKNRPRGEPLVRVAFSAPR